MYNFIKGDWNSILSTEFQKPYFKKLLKFLEAEYNSKNIYPNKKDIFKALNYTSYQNVKVVILGQDPYHGEGLANGLSFSVNNNTPIPPSLKNIFKELNNDLGCYIPNNGDLTSWAMQGILLLNTVLTVEKGKANSHKNIGWENFTDCIISKLDKKDTPIVFILWGNNAISKKSLIKNSIHYIIQSVHPSPLSCHRGFYNSKPFSKTNIFLNSIGTSEINWQIENI